MSNLLITGGAGFIGCNAAARLIRNGHRVTVLDNLSRPGSAKNLEWLRATCASGSLRFLQQDITDSQALAEAVKNQDVVIHLAGQVAVTTSVSDPRSDFNSNAVGTFNVLEAARLASRPPAVLYSSTNKVYGEMSAAVVVETKQRYAYQDYPSGIPETFPLDFHSPYGCSKGAADQYVRDYARIFGLRTVVFRQSCIYGPRQMGVEDQGWLAWFSIAAISGRPITIYGDGKQVRDVLFVDDLIDAYAAAIAHLDVAAGQVYNVGGGPDNTISVWTELGPRLEALFGRKIPVTHGPWRPGDQKIYVSDIRKAQRELKWCPQIGVATGVERLWTWIRENRNLFA